MVLGLSITATWALYLGAAAAAIYLVVAVLPVLVLRRRPHRSWFQRSLLALNCSVVVVALVSASVLTWWEDQWAEVPRQAFGEGVLAEQVESGEPRNFLLVGIDQAEGLDEADPVNIGRNPGSVLSDTVMVLRLVPETGQAHLMSFPRDLWIPIAGTGGRDRINTALQAGGPETLIRTVEEDFGIPIHHYVQVNFAGFKELVRILGGVPMWLPTPIRDPHSGLYLEVPPGGACVTLDADQALAFARSRRQYQVYVDGRWITDPSADFGRIQRQQLFIRLALTQAIDRGARNPTTLSQFIGVGQEHVLLDDQLTAGDLLDIGEQFRDFDPESLHTYELPAEPGWAGPASVVYLLEAEAQDELNVFRGVSNELPTIAGVRVAVRNGSGLPGQATEVSRDLQAAGFTVLSAADAERFDYERTVIRHGPDDKLTAVFLARFLDASVTFEEVPGLGEASVELVTGRDYRGLLAQPRPLEDFAAELPATTTSTSAPTTTTAPPTTAPSSATTISFVPEQPEGVTC